MLDEKTKADLANAISALRRGDDGPWSALAPLSRIASAGTDISIDFTTEATLGAPVIVARQRGTLPEGLTPRQADICAAVAEGLTNKSIARRLGISPATVKDHVHAILGRLGLKSRSEVIALFHGAEPSSQNEAATSIR